MPQTPDVLVDHGLGCMGYLILCGCQRSTRFCRKATKGSGGKGWGAESRDPTHGDHNYGKSGNSSNSLFIACPSDGCRQLAYLSLEFGKSVLRTRRGTSRAVHVVEWVSGAGACECRVAGQGVEWPDRVTDGPRQGG